MVETWLGIYEHGTNNKDYCCSSGLLILVLPG